ncbi:hypothetical protein LSG31_17090 [Fodinisporobacter ferrooxydans]|uniref:Uncharacterized protein n=1 Tax=Fodinisporobacter ferrooxydans TaxID=2901836 RepID=A0ABY4CGD0_9BACL|nr:hypothetical protein LSG31_17090 [Alicyclobacillaceae bacterium MYW30-H2]
MKEKRDDMAINKAQPTPKRIPVSNAQALAAAKRVMDRHKKSFEKLAKN